MMEEDDRVVGQILLAKVIFVFTNRGNKVKSKSQVTFFALLDTMVELFPRPSVRYLRLEFSTTAGLLD